MENENTNVTDYENNTDNNTVSDNTTSYVASNTEEIEMLNTIHTDLGVICSFIIFFVLVIILKYVYKFFDMFFVI